MTQRIFILGGTGNTGTQLIDLALRRGHAVTAFVRTPAKIKREHPLLSIVAGNPLDADALSKAMPGHDAVISAIGVRPPQAFRVHTTVADCAASTVAAMTRARVSRLILVSAAVLFPERGLKFAFFRWFLTQIRRDLMAAESIVQATDLRWTIARPPRLVAGVDETYRTAHDALPTDGFTMSFRGVAAFMLDAVERQSNVGEIIGLAR